MFLNQIRNFINFIFPTYPDNSQEISDILQNKIFFFPKNQSIFFLPYKNKIIKKLLYDLKFKKKYNLAKIFGTILYENLPEILDQLQIQHNFNNYILIPIPISFIRKITRGYDQNKLILKHFQNLGGRHFIEINYDILKRRKHTKPQSKTKTKSERIENIKNAFKIKNPEKIKGKNIILFDDIKTSGSTLNEAKKMLKKAGAKKIIFLTIAH